MKTKYFRLLSFGLLVLVLTMFFRAPKAHAASIASASVSCGSITFTGGGEAGFIKYVRIYMDYTVSASGDPSATPVAVFQNPNWPFFIGTFGSQTVNVSPGTHVWTWADETGSTINGGAAHQEVHGNYYENVPACTPTPTPKPTPTPTPKPTPTPTPKPTPTPTPTPVPPVVTCGVSVAAGFVDTAINPTITISNTKPTAASAYVVKVVINGATYTQNANVPVGTASYPVNMGPIGPLVAGNYTMNASVNGNTGVYAVSTTCSGAATIAARPFFKIFGGDVSVGGCFLATTTATSCTPASGSGKGRVYAFSRYNQFLGSTAQFAVQALGQTGDGVAAPTGTIFNGLPSSTVNTGNDPAGSALTFADNGTVNFGQGAGMGGTHTVPDYYDLTIKPGIPALAAGGRNLSTLITTAGADQQVLINGNLSLTDNLPGKFSGKLAIYVNGDVYIKSTSGSMAMVSGPYATIADIPFFAIIAKGNIYIDKGVYELDGMYVAQPTSAGAKGIVYTCASGLGTLPPPATMQADCSSRLSFNGSIIAKGMKLLRTGENNIPVPAPTDVDPGTSEVFRGMPEMYLTDPPFRTTTSVQWLYDNASDLPPLL